MSEALKSSESIPFSAITFIGMATLLFEILLTRVFSVTMWYHFAFIAISLALFGLAASGVVATVFRKFFESKGASLILGRAAFGFGIAVPVSFLIDLQIPFLLLDSVKGYAFFALKFLVLSLPFFFSGLTIALAFVYFSRHVNRIYFSDLMGGGLGCALVVPVLSTMSAPDAILLTATFPLLSSALLFRNANSKKDSVVSVLLALAVLSFLMINQQTGWIRIVKVKSYDPVKAQENERPKIFERWHPVSRIAVHPVRFSGTPEVWFYSHPIPGGHPKVVEITNDGGARSFLYPASQTGYRYLFDLDVSDLVYSLVKSPKVLVIGVGGGKDILAAKAYDAASVTGVELNPVMIDLVETVFADFTAKPFSNPKVKIVIGEGRNFVASRSDRFDVIKLSGTDTWASSAMGAYSLAENYLYTEEAIHDFVSSLTPNGYLTISRFFPEATRLTALMVEALKKMGVANPAERLLIARNPSTMNIIVKNGMLRAEDIAHFQSAVRNGGHALIYVPGNAVRLSPYPIDQLQRDIVLGKNLKDLTIRTGINLEASTDDHPFFFSLVSIRNALDKKYAATGGFQFQHGRALHLLVGMLFICSIAVLMFLVLPLVFQKNRIFGEVDNATRTVASAYFLLLGIGYLLIEIPLLQRLILFLGHPTYSLTVVLFSLLVASGIGSLTSEALVNSFRKQKIVLLVSVFILGFLAIFLQGFLRTQIGLSSLARILLSILVIAPLGFLLGIPFPIGLRTVSKIHPSLIPWAWALNGAGSVVAPVIAMIVAITHGFTAAHLAGTFTYALAFLFFLKLSALSYAPPLQT